MMFNLSAISSTCSFPLRRIALAAALGTVIVSVGLICPADVFSGEGRSAGQILSVSPDPIQSAAGGSQVALPSVSPAAALTNPAALTGVYRPWLALSYRALPADMRVNYAGFGLPTNFGVISGSILYADYGTIDAYNNNMDRISVPGSNDTAAILSYALPIARRVPVYYEYGAVGLNIKLLHSTLAWYASEAIAVDLGARYNIPMVNGLTAGFVYQNFGSDLKYVKEFGKLPTAAVAGLGYTNAKYRDLTVSADYRMPATGVSGVCFGIGFSPVYFMTIRTGWQQVPDALANGMRAGVGFRFGDFSLDYTFVPQSYFGAEHHVGLGIALGPMDKLRTASDYYLDSHYRAACESYYRKDYIEARQRFEEILSVYPDHVPSQSYLNKVATALEQEAQNRDDSVSRALAHANSMVEKKDLVEASRQYRRILAIDPENPAAKLGLDHIAELTEDVKREKLVEKNREKIERIWQRAERAYREGNLVQSKTLFEDVLSIDSENAEAKKYIVEIDNQLSKIAAEKVNELFARGLDLFRNADYYEAMRYFEAVLLAAPQRLDAEDFIKRCRDSIDELEAKGRAEQLARDQDRMRSEMASVYDRALKDYGKGRYEPAYQSFLKAEELAKKYQFTEYQENIKNYLATVRGILAEEHYKRGFEYFRRNNREDAAAEYKKSLEYYPDYTSALVELERLGAEMAQIYYERGMAFYTKNEIDKAREMFKKSLSYRPDKQESLRALERIR